MDHWKVCCLLASAAALSACSDSPAPTEVTETATTAAETAGEIADIAAPGRVFIVSPADGDTVSSPVTVVFGIDGYSVAPAGTYAPQTGHHHLLIDTGVPALDQPVPADSNHVHFGKGQTETTIELAAGEHTLQLLLGDGNHMPHEPPLTSHIISISVTE